MREISDHCRETMTFNAKLTDVLLVVAVADLGLLAGGLSQS